MQFLVGLFGLALASAADLPASPAVATPGEAPVAAPVAEPAPTPAAAAQPAGQRTVRLPAGTPVVVELAAPLSSNTNRLGDTFPIRLVEPIVVGGETIVAAGAEGRGEVIDAAHSGMSGKQGKLIIAARYLDLNGKRVRIRGLTFIGAGTSRVDLATGVAIVVPYGGLLLPFIQGGELKMPAGTRATAKFGEEMELPLPAAAGAN